MQVYMQKTDLCFLICMRQSFTLEEAILLEMFKFCLTLINKRNLHFSVHCNRICKI